jgi:hypothetical protein
MARAALVIEMSVMRVVFQVAGNAIGFGVGENLGCMTGITFRFPMRAEAWELRQIVIEKYGFLPFCFRMAVFALRAKSPFVDFIFEMTRFAARL